MHAGLPGFALGIIGWQHASSLPDWPWWIGIALGSGLLLLANPVARLLGGIALGVCWAGLHAQIGLDHRLPVALDGEDLVITGRVVGLPEHHGHRTRFLLAPDTAEDLSGQPLEGPLPRRIRLSGYGLAKPPGAGERWQLTVRLRPPGGTLNPGGFDFERWLHQQRLDATGYVRDAPPPARLQSGQGLHAWREQVAERVRAQLPGDETAALLPALAVADRSDMTTRQWEVLSATGTGHLLAISGLHIGLVAGFGFLLGGLAWCAVPGLTARIPARLAGAVVALLLATSYAALAGFTLPTRRALIMLCVGLGALWLRRRPGSWHALLIALAAVLVLDPLAPLGPGFWLSFGAVAIILVLVAQRGRTAGWLGALRMHALISLAILPVIGVWFGELPLVSAPANMLAIPVVAMLVVPPLLLSLPLLWPAPWLAGLLLSWSHGVLDGLMGVLVWMADHGQLGASAIAATGLWVAGLGAALLLLPRGWPGRWLGVPLLALPVLATPVTPQVVDDPQVTILDAGQGLVSVATVGDQALVYGTGARLGPRTVVAERTLIPWLETQGLSPRYLVPGGEGGAWTGGLSTLQQHFPGAETITTCDTPLPDMPGVVLAPAGQGCDLQITLGDRRALLTAREEPAGEQAGAPWAAIVAPEGYFSAADGDGAAPPPLAVVYPVTSEQARLNHVREAARHHHHPGVAGALTLSAAGRKGLALTCFMAGEGRHYHRPWATSRRSDVPARHPVNPLSSRPCHPGQ